MSARYLPSVGQLVRASKKLPDPNESRENCFEVPLGESKKHVIAFQKIRYKSTQGKVNRWVYEGKVMFK